MASNVFFGRAHLEMNKKNTGKYALTKLNIPFRDVYLHTRNSTAVLGFVLTFREDSIVAFLIKFLSNHHYTSQLPVSCGNIV